MQVREAWSAVRESPRTAREIARSMLRALAIVRRASPGGTAAFALLTVVSGALPALLAYVAREVLDGVVRAARSGSTDDRAQVFRWIAIELAMVVVSSGAGQWLGAAAQALSLRLGQFVDERILEKALTLRLEDFEQSETLDRLKRARKGSGAPIGVMDSALDLGRSVLGLAGFGVLLVHLSAWTVAVIFVATVPQFVANTFFTKKRFTLGNWRTEETRQQSYYEWVLTSAEHVKELRLFGLGELFLGRYRDIYARFERQDREAIGRQGLWMFAWSGIGSLAYYGAYAWAALEAMRSRITVGELGMYLLVFKQGQSMIGSLLSSVGSIYHNHLYLGPLFEFLDLEIPHNPTGGVTEGPTPRDGFRFERVSFTYPGAESPALVDLDLRIPAGHKLALVGENGAGKTTLIKLLTRLYVPSSGRILLDGADLNAWDAVALRKRIGVIFQDFVEYHLTAGENIGVGDVESLDDRARIRDAAHKGMADEFIEAMPEGYETRLGSWWRKSHDLSVGQWQRIALSRAFMRRGSDILVLDEPTASLDAQAEAHIFDRFRALAENRTAILISHRFSTTRMADSIAVIVKGRIVEHGSHEALLAQGGRYAELFFLQAKGYR